ncbi:MAG: hypothetical protein ACRC33_13890 [Gemmataceae bacterium]
MTRLIVDDAVAALLTAAKVETTVVDRTGRVIGRFRPTLDQAAMHARYGHLWTDEDLARAEAIEKEFFENGRKGYTHAEVWEYIREQEPK